MGSKKIKRSHKVSRKGRPASRRHQGHQGKAIEVLAGVAKTVGGKPYSPRPGTVPDWIYRSLTERPMLFGELSVHVGQATGMSGDNLASQLSASLRDLVVRGAVVRLHHDTKKPMAEKNARGALYSLVPTAKAAYLTAKKGIRKSPVLPSKEIFSGAPAPDPNGAQPHQLDLSSFPKTAGAGLVLGGAMNVSDKPARMSVVMFAELMRAQEAARSQLAAIEAMLRDSAWT
jgi:hypothetical protein